MTKAFNINELCLKNNFRYCGGSTVTRLYNPLEGAYYRSYRYTSVKSSHSAATYG